MREVAEGEKSMPWIVGARLLIGLDPSQNEYAGQVQVGSDTVLIEDIMYKQKEHLKQLCLYLLPNHVSSFLP